MIKPRKQEKFMVYLAGPINGKSYEAAIAWRKEATKLFKDHFAHVLCINPLEGLEHLAGQGTLTEDGHEAHEQGIFNRALDSATQSDAILVNLTGATKLSLGTISEMAWAYDHRVPMFIAMEKGNPHEGMFLRAYARHGDHEVCPNIETAITKLVMHINKQQRDMEHG